MTSTPSQATTTSNRWVFPSSKLTSAAVGVLDNGGDGDPSTYISISATGLEKPNEVGTADHEQGPNLTREDREVERLEHLARAARQLVALEWKGLFDQLFVSAKPWRTQLPTG